MPADRYYTLPDRSSLYSWPSDDDTLPYRAEMHSELKLASDARAMHNYPAAHRALKRARVAGRMAAYSQRIPERGER